jgi:hypothetical protein
LFSIQLNLVTLVKKKVSKPSFIALTTYMAPSYFEKLLKILEAFTSKVSSKNKARKILKSDVTLGREGKGREGKGREGKGREGKGRDD